jgi:hypothetical protein
MPRLTILVFLLAISVNASEVLNNTAVVRMVSAGLGADVIVLKIERSDGAFDTSADDLIALKGAHVPDAVIRAMLMKDVAAATPPPPVVTPSVPLATPPTRQSAPAGVGVSEDVCANVKFYTTGNEGLAWLRSNVCVGASGVSADEQTIALSEVVAQCTSKPSVLVMGGSLLHGEQEWWIGDTTETLKFRGRQEDLDRLAAALTQARKGIPSGGCNDRDVRRRFVRP